MAPIPLLVFHLVHAFGNADRLDNLIISKTIVSIKLSQNFLCSSEPC